MNDQDLEQFEQVLRDLRPAKPRAQFVARLARANPDERRVETSATSVPSPAPSSFAADVRETRPGYESWRFLLRWLVPTAALTAILVIVWVVFQPSGPPRPTSMAVAESPRFRADDVQVDQELVTTFDVVGRLNSGEPVRFRCQQWMDELVLRDSGQGVTIQQRIPRVEVVPVRFETY